VTPRQDQKPAAPATSTRRVSRQREAGEATRRETRRKLLMAAVDEFAERGYRAATVARIAERADVAVQTLYHSWGSKRALLRGVLELAIIGHGDDTLTSGELPRVMLAQVDPADVADHPEQLVAHLVHQFRVLAERAASVWGTYRDAAAVDLEIAADWHALMQIRRDNFVILLGAAPADGWRAELSFDQVVDTAWTLASPHTYELLVVDAGYDLDRYEQWVYDTLCAALLRG
jgi:AcrR family transcriptional regulator